MVIHPSHVNGRTEGKLTQQCSRGGEDLRRSAANVLAPDHHHHHKIDAVPMRAFGCRQTRRIGSRFNAELVHFDPPIARLTHPRIEYLSSAGEQVTQNTVLCHGGQHGLEPTLNATVQRVVVQRLKVGLVGFTLPKLARRAAEDGMPSPPML